MDYIPKSVHPEIDFILSDEDMSVMASLDKKQSSFSSNAPQSEVGTWVRGLGLAANP